MTGSEAIQSCLDLLIMAGTTVDTGHWQGVSTVGDPSLVTKEVLNINFSCAIPHTVEMAQEECQPNLPWAETEFQERVGRVPRNPHESLSQWPWWRGQTEATMHDGVFTHTYSERFWPKSVGVTHPASGLRYGFGDLDDVIALLRKHPHTRQATFPIFFPEDTGAVHGGRIPCTLHYHFLLREDRLHLFYPIRSCDAVRHFRDDIYMAMRLNQWVLDELRQLRPGIESTMWAGVQPGDLNFTAYSFHVHMGDYHLLESA